MATPIVMGNDNRRAPLPAVPDVLLADPASLEVAVVGDGCHDRWVEDLPRLVRREVRLRPVFVENSAAVRTQHVGVETAVGDVVLILEGDVIAVPRLVTGHPAA